MLWHAGAQIRTDGDVQLDRLPALDGLRAVSILIVVLSHFMTLIGLKHVPGRLGVTIFFFISGFIITRLLLREDERTGTVRLSRFYIRRWFRLSPALLVCVAITVTVLARLGYYVPWADTAAVLFYYANYHEIFSGFALTGSVGESPFVVTWSLAVEEHFYAILPLLVLICRRNLDRLLLILAIFVVAVLFWRMILVYGVGLDHLHLFRVYMATDTRLDSIAYGCLLSVAFTRNYVKGVLDRLGGSIGLALSALLLGLSLAIRNPEFRETEIYSMQGLALIPLFCALFRGAQPSWLKTALTNRLMLFIGAISYSLYLYHYLAYVIVQHFILPPTAQMALAWILAFGAASLSYYAIEMPMRRLGHRIT
jgi:peptidoglycan/LPS O-acetylase OafA/YrhL